MPYADLELSLQRQGDDYAAELRFQPAPDEAVAYLVRGEPPRVRFADASLQDQALDAGAYGARLAAMLFADARLRAAFAKARAHAEAAHAPLRVRLRLDADDAAIHSLRWETLCDPDGSGFLCASERLLVTRYLDSADLAPLDVRPRAALRALVAVANPSGLEHYRDLAPVDVAGEVARSQAALAGIPTAVLGREAGGRPASLDAIVAGLRDGPDILYLVAHGTVKDGESYLWLENEAGGIGRASGAELATQIHNLADRPLLIVLAACQSAGTSHSAGALAALGPKLAAAGIAAVVAMQGNVSMDTIAEFMPLFFRELQRDGQIDRALAAARASVLERPDWWMPVLFLRTPNGMLWRAPPPDALPAAPQPERPAEAADFVGRAAELATFAARLASEHVAEITGMPGVGKTALAAVLAARVAPPSQIFWHSFRSGEGIEALIWALAGFLAWRGQPDLWALLQRGRQGDSQPPPDVLFDYLVPMLDGHGYLLCLDDFQYVDDDPQLDQFVERLRPQLRAGTLTLLVTSRRAPGFAALSEVEMLSGLSAADARELVAARGLTLPDSIFDQLYLQTGGNAQLLALAIDALRRTQYPEQLVADLIAADDIVRYLMRDVDADLSDAEREVMQAAAILLDHGGTRAALKAVLDGVSIRATLLALIERYLLTASEGPTGKEYRPHAMIQAFYYDDLDRAARVMLHRRAALFYATEERQPVRAALHFERAGDDARAADIATAETSALINQGQARPLRQLLERFVARQLEPADPRHLDDERWTAINIACGEVYARLGDADLAREHYQAAFDLLAAGAGSANAHARMAAVCRGMAEVLEYQSPQEALVWLQRGKAAASELPQEHGILLLREGSVQIGLGALDLAAAALEHSLRLLPAGAALWRGKAQLNLGVIACMGGDLARGKDHFLQAEALFQHSRDDWDLATVRQNLGRVQAFTGDWPGAADTYRRALELAVRLGNRARQAALEYCLGTLETNQGMAASATTHLLSCLALANAHKLREHVVSAQAALADLHIRQGDWDAAAGALAEAERIALDMDTNEQLPEIHRLAAELRLGRADATAATTSAEQALALAGTLGDHFAEGMSLRTLAQALLAAGRPTEAPAAFERSLALLDDIDRYEAARTRACWGAACLAGGDMPRGAELLEAARATFAQLGARRDLLEAEAALAALNRRERQDTES